MIKHRFISVGILHLPVAQALNEDIVRILQDTHLFRSYITQDTHSQPRSGERMAGNQMIRHAQLASYAANFVLKQQTQRLAQLQMHFFGQSSHIVMALDNRSGDRKRLNAIRIDSTLCQPLYIFYLMGFFIKHINKSLSYNLAFSFRLGHSCQLRKEFGTCVHAYYVQSQTLIIVQHILELILTQHAMIHEDTSQVLTDSTIQQYGSNGRIHSATQAKHHFVISKLFFQLGNGSFNE